VETVLHPRVWGGCVLRHIYSAVVWGVGGGEWLLHRTPGSCTSQWQMGNRQEVEATGMNRAGDLHRECPLWKQGCQEGPHLCPLACKHKMDVGVKFDSLIKAVWSAYDQLFLTFFGTCKLHVNSIIWKKKFWNFPVEVWNESVTYFFLQNFSVFFAALPNQWQAIVYIQNALDYSSLCIWPFFHFWKEVLGNSFCFFIYFWRTRGSFS
jgi:hypothetical protein